MVEEKVTRPQDFLPDFGAPAAKKKTTQPRPVSEAEATKSPPPVPKMAVQSGGQGERLESPVPSDIIEKRVDRRVSTELQAQLIINIGAMDCTTVDLSANGVKLRLDHDLLKNIRVNIAGSGEIPGEVIWKDGEFVGIKFHEEQSEIVNVLARVTS